METEKGVVFSQRAGPPPSLPLVPHSLTRCFLSSAVGFGVRTAECGLRCSLRFSHDRMAEVPPPPLRVTRFALHMALHHFNFSPSTSLFSLPTTTRRRSPEFPLPSSSLPSLHLIIFVHCGDFPGPPPPPPWRPSTSYSHGDRLTAERLQCGSEPMGEGGRRAM